MSETELAERLERLESDNRRLKGFGAAALVISAALGLIAATRPVPDVIKAHEFDVVDSSGKVRLKMDASKGQPLIEMKDWQGASVIKLGFDKADGPSLTLWLPPWDCSWPSPPKKGQVAHAAKAVIAIPRSGSPSITLSDSKGLMYLYSTGTAKFGPSVPLKR